MRSKTFRLRGQSVRARNLVERGFAFAALLVIFYTSCPTRSPIARGAAARPTFARASRCSRFWCAHNRCSPVRPEDARATVLSWASCSCAVTVSLRMVSRAAFALTHVRPANWHDRTHCSRPADGRQVYGAGFAACPGSGPLNAMALRRAECSGSSGRALRTQSGRGEPMTASATATSCQLGVIWRRRCSSTSHRRRPDVALLGDVFAVGLRAPRTHRTRRMTMPFLVPARKRRRQDAGVVCVLHVARGALARRR